MRALHAEGKKIRATRTAEAILQIDDENVEALRLLGRIYLNEKRFRPALELWKRIVELMPNDPEAALQVARIAWRNEDFAVAGRYAKAMLAIAPDNFKVSILLSRHYTGCRLR